MTRAVGSIQFKTLIILINDRIYDVLCYLKIKDVVLKQKHVVKNNRPKGVLEAKIAIISS